MEIPPKSSPDSDLDDQPKYHFFKKTQHTRTLPTPSEVRAINSQKAETNACRSYHLLDFARPPPVMYPSLGLCVKYGGDITIVQAQTQHLVHERLLG